MASEIERRYRERLRARLEAEEEQRRVAAQAPDERLGSLVRQAEEVLEQARVRAEALLSQADAEARRTRDDAEAEGQALVGETLQRVRRLRRRGERQLRLVAQRAEEEARARGHARGVAEAARTMVARRRQAEDLLAALEGLRVDLEARARARAAELAVDLARRCLGLVEDQHPEVFVDALAGLLEGGAPAEDALDLEVHPSWVGALKGLRPVADGRVRVHASAEVPRGRARLFTPDRVVELDPLARLAALGEQIERAAHEEVGE